jgi:uncharacterized cupredoxin-like copper-binding protein
MNIVSRSVFAAAATLLLSGSAFAATTAVNVMLMGEGGGPMKIEIDKAAIPSGDVVFNVANHAMTEQHEVVLVKLKSADQTIPLDTKKHRVDEKQLKSLGEVADLQPSDTGTLKAKLKPGTYLLLCNIKGHYEAGMSTKLTVN